MTAVASTVTIRVLLFASYAELLGSDSLEIVLDIPARVRDAVERLRALPGAERLPAKPLCAVNLTQVTPDTPLRPGDELAILPPLSGG